MYKPSNAINSSTNIMVQTLSSLLQRVHILGSEETPPDLNSPVSHSRDKVFKTSSQSAASKPIPYTPGYSNYKYGDCSLESNYDHSLAESSNYDNSLANSTNYSTSIFPGEYESNVDDQFPLFGHIEYSDKSDDEDNLDEEELTCKSGKKKTNSLPEISLCEVAQHDMFHDCWIVFYDKIYNVTDFLYEHPGGEELLMEHAGRDGTMAFRSVGHSKAALESLKDYIIGILPSHERIFNDWETT